MPGRLEVLGYIRRNESDSLQIPLTIGSGPSMRTIWFDAVQGPEATQVYEQQSREPVLLRGGFEDCSWSLWAYKGKLIRCDLPIHYIDDDSSVAEELTLRIKHLVLREEHRLQRIRREVQALENLERIPSAKRERIPDDVRLFVWQRDEGKCVSCGSRERLEFDHIIPFAEGGSSTERNVQLLCEACNRQKGKKI
jgi:hypothetical protein